MRATGAVMHNVSWDSKLYLQKEPANNLDNEYAKPCSTSPLSHVTNFLPHELESLQ